MNNEILKIVIQVFGNFHRNHVCVIPCVNLYDQLQLVRRAYLSLVVVIQSFIISLTSSWINLVGCYINTTKRIAKLDRTLKPLSQNPSRPMIDTKFFPVHSSIFKYPFKLVHRLTRFKSNGDARIGIVETWKGTSRSERYPLQFQIPPLPTYPYVPSLTANIRNCNARRSTPLFGYFYLFIQQVGESTGTKIRGEQRNSTMRPHNVYVKCVGSNCHGNYSTSVRRPLSV